MHTYDVDRAFNVKICITVHVCQSRSKTPIQTNTVVGMSPRDNIAFIYIYSTSPVLRNTLQIGPHRIQTTKINQLTAIRRSSRGPCWIMRPHVRGSIIEECLSCSKLPDFLLLFLERFTSWFFLGIFFPEKEMLRKSSCCFAFCANSWFSSYLPLFSLFCFLFISRKRWKSGQNSLDNK